MSEIYRSSIKKINIQNTGLETVLPDVTCTRVVEEQQVDMRKFYASVARIKQ